MGYHIVLDCLPCDTSELIPHGGSMALIDQLLEFNAQSRTGRVSCQLKAEKPYWTKDKRFLDHWLVEIMAQAAAAVAFATGERGDGPPTVGYLLALRDWRMLRQVQLKPADTLMITVQLETGHPGIAHGLMQVSQQEYLIAESTMTFFTDKDDLKS